MSETYTMIKYPGKVERTTYELAEILLKNESACHCYENLNKVIFYNRFPSRKSDRDLFIYKLENQMFYLKFIITDAIL